jgi:hypothetical protein
MENIWNKIKSMSRLNITLKQLNQIQVIVVILMLITSVIVLINTKKQRKVNLDNVMMLLHEYVENAYAEGQANAMKGDIRITQINDTTYVWNKTPWDSGKAPVKDTIIIK